VEAHHLVHDATVPDLFVVTGISASGKTTVGRALADRLHPSAFIEGDVIRRMVHNGRVEMTPGASAAALAQLRIRYRHTAILANSYREHGFHVVVEDIIIGTALTEFLGYLAASPVHLVVLTPDATVVAERERGRQKSAYAADWQICHYDSVLRERTPRLGLWLDTGRQSPDATVAEILARRGEALLSGVPS